MMVDGYNKIALIKLTESYLARAVLQDELIGFLKNNFGKRQLSSIRSVSKEIASLAGKDVNSIYKNKNELQIYNGVGLIRYWDATIKLCEIYKIPEDKRPKFENILKKYESTLDFLSIITAEDELNSLVSNNLYEVLKIINFYQKITPQSISEIEMLNQLKENEQVKTTIYKQEEASKLTLLERMQRK